MPEKQKISTVYLILVLAMIFWSFSYVWLKTVFIHINPVSTTFFRLIIASVFLLLLSVLLRKLQPVQKKDILRFLLLAFFEPFLYYFGESYGVSLVSPTLAAVVIATIPLIVPVSMYFIAGEKLFKNQIAGLVVSFAGVLLVVLQSDEGFAASLTGLLCLTVAVLSVAGYSFLLQDMTRSYNAYTLISMQNLIGIVYFLPFFFWLDDGKFMAIDWNPKLIIYLLLLAVFASALAFFFFTAAVARIGVSRATTFSYFIPVFTALLSYLLFDEAFGYRKLAGIAVVVAGLLIAHRKR